MEFVLGAIVLTIGILLGATIVQAAHNANKQKEEE